MSVSPTLELSAPQSVYLTGLKTKYRAYVGGFGSGKTFVGCLDLLIFAARYPRVPQGYFGPTYPSIRDIFFPTFEEAASRLDFQADVKEANKEIDLYRGGRWYGKIICRSMEKPDRIVGFKVARAMCDEIDTLPKRKAEQAWNKIIARLRYTIDGVVNGIGVTTTPEGFSFVYDRFASAPSESYSMVQASTHENAEYLPSDYIPSLLETYPEQLVSAYVGGEFVNLTSGSVYSSYDRARCGSTESVQAGEPLHVGMDFNVGNMAACINVKRPGGYHCVDEIKKGLDTPAILRTLEERYPDHSITIYPDASGASKSSKSASESDFSLIREAGHRIKANSTNPRVRGRVLAVNKALETGAWRVNALRCPETAKCLEQQAYDDNGEPDKKSGHDHQNDAFGYPVAFIMPVKRPSFSPSIPRGGSYYG